ncbi:MAG: hypothetical protein JWQ57_2772 [Mucilaginibacter sp.]|nr:hypothetical protein [Mucilaginibacter sp.]
MQYATYDKFNCCAKRLTLQKAHVMRLYVKMASQYLDFSILAYSLL